MFVCRPCHKEQISQFEHYMVSVGPCELCRITKECYDCSCDNNVVLDTKESVPNTLVEKKMTTPFILPPVWDGNARDRLKTNAAKDMIKHYAEYIANSGFRGDPYVRAVNDFAKQLLEIETEAKRQGAAYDGR